MKKLVSVFPELYFILITALLTAENYFSLGKFNYFAILVGWLMFLQLFYKHRTLGLIYGNLLSFTSVYMLGSLISNFDASASLIPQLAAFMFSGIGLIMGIAMVYKFVKATSKYDESVLTVSF